MGFWFDSFIIDFIVAILFLLTVLVLYVKYQFTHWTRHGIYQIQPEIPFGNTKDLILKRISLGMGYERIYDHFKKLNLPFAGMYNFTTPEFMPLDPELTKQLLVKEFQHFPDRGTFVDEEIDPISGNIFSLEGSKWKDLRSKLSPAFTSGKMKMMFPTLVACADEMMDIVFDASRKQEPIDFRDLLARFTTDVIGSCAFGLNCNSLKNPDTNFRKYSKMALAPEGIDKLRAIVGFFFPKVLKFFKIPIFVPDVSKFFIGTVAETVKYREENNIIRKDFMHLCIQLKNFGRVSSDSAEPGNLKGDDAVAGGQGLTVNQIAAQCFAFFLAGFETSSATMAFSLYELSKQPELQDKLRQDIIESLRKHNGEYSYEAVMGMNYLDKVINETLRKYPPLPFLNRKCSRDYKVPNSNYTIKKGDKLRFSVMGIHRDDRYYPDPEKFDPERFSENEKAKRPPMTFIPFGEGPRICIGIGMRFGLMEAKVGLSSLLKNYRFKLNPKTDDPLHINASSPLLTTNGVWLDVEKVVS